MWARIALCISVLLALLVVILLAVFTPKPHNTSPNSGEDDQDQLWLDLSLYIQEPRAEARSPRPVAAQADAGALVFHRTLTEGPENTSRIVGRAQGFIIPVEQFARSDFNVLYLSFDTPQYSGSLGVRAKRVEPNSAGGAQEELTVVGGTGSFAFARGLAVFAAQPGGGGDPSGASYHVKLQLRFPNQSRTTVPIPG